jgi:hypothetical protein
MKSAVDSYCLTAHSFGARNPEALAGMCDRGNNADAAFATNRLGARVRDLF